MTETDLVLVGAHVEQFELDQRRAKAYAESGYWPDAASVAKALVKIEAGRSLGLPALVAMNEVHVIDGKPTVGAGALAAKVKESPRYDYRLIEITAQQCTLRFYEHDEHVGDSTFSIKDAETAGLDKRPVWKQYPRNMLFARAISNGVAWYCPDVTMGRVYTGDEIEAATAPVEPPDPMVDDEIPYSDPLEPDFTEAEEFEREYLNNEEAVTQALEIELDAEPEP